MNDMQTIDLVPDEHLWNQVIARHTGTDFLYAVTTMGVYCRPGCPSPRPLRKHVRFFDASAEAEAAGFRACRRCDPKGERARIAQQVVRDACHYMEAQEELPSLQTLAARSGYSRFHFLRMFRDHTGLTPRRYAEGLRARRLHTALAGGNRVADAVAEAGFGSESRVYEKTAGLLGMTPGAARRGGKGEVIRTALADCPFGRLLVGATDKGVCFIGFAEPDVGFDGRTSPPVSRRRRSPWTIRTSPTRCGLCWRSCGNRNRRWTCRWIYVEPPSSSVFGELCATFPLERPELMRNWQRWPAIPKPSVLSLALVRPILLLWRSPATGWSEAMAS